MSENAKTKIVVDRLAQNLHKYAIPQLQRLLTDYTAKIRRDLLFQEKEFDEEIYIVFPDFEKELKIEPVSYEVSPNLSFAFNLSGIYGQLQMKEYTYKYKGYVPDNLREQMKKVGIINEDVDMENEVEPYTLLTLAGPVSHKNLEFLYGELYRPVKELGRGRFEVPLNVTFRPEAGGFRFDSMYLSDPEGNREDCLTDAYNRPICLMPLDKVFHTMEMPEGGSRFVAQTFMKDPYREPQYKLLGTIPEPDEALKVDAGDLEIPDDVNVNASAHTFEGMFEADDGEIEVSHSMLAERLKSSLHKNLFRLDDLDEDVSGTVAKTPEERAEDILSDFAVFQYERSRFGKNVFYHQELSRARHNLLIKANDMERALEFVDVLRENVFPRIEHKECAWLREADLKDLNVLKDLIVLFEEKKLIVIYDCEEKPVLKTDAIGTGTERDSVKKEIERYELRWGLIAECATKPYAAKLIVIADDIAYRRTIRFNPEIHDVVCGSHLWLKDLTQDEVYRLFMKELEDSSFGKKLDNDFKANVKEYVRAVYPKSEIQGMRFIKAHLDKIYAGYILKGNDDDSLTGCLPPYRMPSVDKILEELRGKTGLGDVVKRFETIYAMKDVLVRAGEPYHMSFEGNPGTGKTMVAKMVAEMFYHMGVTRKPRLVEAGAGDFRSLWKGGTNEKVKGLIREAYGGVLFIDEAYALADDDFREGLALLLTEMADKDNPERPVVILAGYEEQMRDLLKSNEGLDSRIKYHVKFRDYTRTELKSILKDKLRELEFTVEESDEAEDLLEALIMEKMSSEFFGNARDMEKLCFELIGRWGEKKAELEEDGEFNQPLIRTEHMKKLLPKTDTESINHILEDQPELKAELDRFKDGVAYKKALQKNTGNLDIPAVNMHMVFAGNPGTGKTTVAERLADYLCEMHVLPTNKCITAEAKDLLTYAKNMTPAEHTEDYIERAKGGILFIDEAYSLAKERGGEEVIHVLLTAMEKYKENTIFIFAGYLGEMDDFLMMNPGLRSRIGYTFRFKSYEEDVLVKMFIKKMDALELSFKDKEDAEKELAGIMRYFRRMKDFGNGRFVESLLNATMNRHGERLVQKYPGNKKNPPLSDCPSEEIKIYTTDDLPTKKEVLKGFFGIDRDPDEYEKKEKETTVIHELGHATVAMAADPDRILGGIRVVEEINVRSAYDAYGYVKYDPSKIRTEQDYKIHLASMLGGRNAEKLYFGSHTGGCRQDYMSAKMLAKQMIRDFAMGDLGITSKTELLQEADSWATRLLNENKEFIDAVKPFLTEYEEMKGEDIEGLYRTYKNGGMDDLKTYLKGLEDIYNKDSVNTAL